MVKLTWLKRASGLHKHLLWYLSQTNWAEGRDLSEDIMTLFSPTTGEKWSLLVSKGNTINKSDHSCHGVSIPLWSLQDVGHLILKQVRFNQTQTTVPSCLYRPTPNMFKKWVKPKLIGGFHWQKVWRIKKCVKDKITIRRRGRWGEIQREQKADETEYPAADVEQRYGCVCVINDFTTTRIHTTPPEHHLHTVITSAASQDIKSSHLHPPTLYTNHLLYCSSVFFCCNLIFLPSFISPFRSAINHFISHSFFLNFLLTAGTLISQTVINTFFFHLAHKHTESRSLKWTRRLLCG